MSVLVPILALVLALILTHAQTASTTATNIADSVDEECYVDVDGCSVPGQLPFFYKTKFTPACNKHDVCYSCGGHYKWSRESCDDSFLYDMEYLCSKPTMKTFIGGILQAIRELIREEKQRCRGFSMVYYHTVDKFGAFRYMIDSPSWCNQQCVYKYGHPGRRLEHKLQHPE